jgi:hypothetical protein
MYLPSHAFWAKQTKITDRLQKVIERARRTCHLPNLGGYDLLNRVGEHWVTH